MYTLTPHAYLRIQERNITPDELAGALASRVLPHQHGTQMHFDRSSRLAIIFNPQSHQIVTVFRLQRKQVKKWCSR